MRSARPASLQALPSDAPHCLMLTRRHGRIKLLTVIPADGALLSVYGTTAQTAPPTSAKEAHSKSRWDDHFMDHANEAKKLRERAEECRALAEIMKEDAARDGYLALAKSYEALAEREEAMIGMPHDTIGEP